MGEDGRLGAQELDELLGPTPHDIPTGAGRAPHSSLDGNADPRGAANGHDGPDPAPSGGRLTPEVLAQGPDRPTSGQRTADLLHRHRWITVVAALATLVAATGAVTWWHGRAPSPRTGLAASAWYRPSLPEMTSVNVNEGVVTSTIYLQVPPGAPLPTAVSLTGQGLGGSMLTQDGSDVTVTSPLDCSTIGDLSAAAQPTVLHVRLPGTTGSELTEELPLSLNPGTAGIPVADAVAALRRACVGQISDALVLLGVRAGATSAGEVLALRVQNPTRHDLVLLGAQTDLAPSDASIGAPLPAPGLADPGQQATQGQGALLPAGATTSVTLPVVRTNCADVATGAAASAGLGAGAGRPTGDFALWVSPPGPQSYPRDDSWTARALAPPARAAVEAALAAPCTGAPALSYRVSAVRAGNPGSGVVTFQVLAHATTGRLSISGQGALGNLMSVTVAQRASSAGRLDVTVEMSYAYCATGFDQILPPPPVLSLEAQVGTGSYPFQVAVGNRTVLDAFGRACGQQPDLGLARSAGWGI